MRVLFSSRILKNKERKGGKYVFFWRRLKTEKENIFFAVEEENIWKRKIFFCGGETKWRRKRRKNIMGKEKLLRYG